MDDAHLKPRQKKMALPQENAAAALFCAFRQKIAANKVFCKIKLDFPPCGRCILIEEKG